MFATKEESQEQKEISRNIANTILEQMKCMDMNLLFCMGFKNPLIIPNGLQFSVSGLSFKGDVQVTLNGSDLYDVRLIKNIRKLDKELSEIAGQRFYQTECRTQEEICDLYFDNLMEVLEDRVERGN